MSMNDCNVVLREKFTQHMNLTRKLMKPLPGQRTKRFLRKIVRIIVTDHDATDSSSDEEAELYDRRRVKKYHNVVLVEAGTDSTRKMEVSDDDHGGKRAKPVRDSSEKRYRGVRYRAWGTFGAEIRHPTKKEKLWLGTYGTPEEAARVYDTAAISLHGAKALTNFGNPSRKVEKQIFVQSNMSNESMEGSYQNTLTSPTSGLRNENQPALEEATDKGKGKEKVEVVEFSAEEDGPCRKLNTMNSYMPMDNLFEDDYGFGSMEPITFDNLPIFPDEEMLKINYDDKDLGINLSFPIPLKKDRNFLDNDGLDIGVDSGFSYEVIYGIGTTGSTSGVIDDYDFEDNDFSLATD
ncbi:hypothetical protein DCAR_0623996 [Daucus carota subsp. sativus]|uniref:AP2/ERF domain-containing protein n=1 Tax=Daucus carota subsp. sativus TaxID=79200 RepID=A0AAF0XA87_DAUCS|nr:PREDICTED: pathogenesis-related genes transcriptional activator PTI6-like [Daucus carota subsp. sativus]WOH04586.1 hypothetical protein DCAR_0623996 [Daucus carota subsp. sativus]